MVIKRTDSENKDFSKLIKSLDLEFLSRNKEAFAVCSPHNGIEKIKHVVVAYEGDKPIGCGAIREYANGVMEVKRMFVLDEYRGRGIASGILHELEAWAKELNYKKCILETGRGFIDAVGLYKKNKYSVIPNYKPYENIESSICFEKKLDESLCTK